MDCTEIKINLQALIDNILIKDELQSVKAHLKTCPACRSELNALRSVADGLAGLTLYEPSKDFNRTVFTRLGLEYQPSLFPGWLSWSVAGSLSLLLSWLAAIAVGLSLTAYAMKPYKVLFWLQHPGKTISDVQMALVKIGFAINDTVGFLANLLGFLLKGSSLPAQLAVASIVAFAIISITIRFLRPQPKYH